MITKLNKASYVFRVLKPLLSHEPLKMVYFLTIHSIISHGIIFWGISAYRKIIFKTQKRIVRIIMNSDNRESCRELFKKLGILPLQPQYIFSYLCLLLRIRTLLKQTQTFIVSTQDSIMTYIFP